MDTATQRLDKWLWFTRLIKTRSQASKLISEGRVRVNKIKVTKPSSCVQEGDVVTVVIHHRLRIIKVLAPGARRGPASEAIELYEDLSPEVQNTHSNSTEGEMQFSPQAPKREKGAGRPTKRDRRKMDALEKQSGNSD